MTDLSPSLECQGLRRVLGEVLEGAAEPGALAHLAACPTCRLLVEELSAITSGAAQLPAYEPTPLLWPRIRHAAEQEGLLEASWVGQLGRYFGFVSPLALRPAFSAALGLLLVAAGLLVGYPSLRVGPGPEGLANRLDVARSELALAPDYGERYARHLDDIEAALFQELAPADTQLTQVAHTNLKTLDQFIERCQSRLTSYPEDEFTRDELNRLYQQKTTLLQAMLDPDWQTSLR